MKTGESKINGQPKARVRARFTTASIADSLRLFTIASGNMEFVERAGKKAKQAHRVTG
jgi:hypothetical protein